MLQQLPVLVVTTILAFVCGRGIRDRLIQAAITLVCVLIGGLIRAGVGQIIGVAVSAVIIFFVFTLPGERRKSRTETEREKNLDTDINEEDN